MSADFLKHKDVTDKVLRCFFDVYNELGSGFLESVYERALCHALAEAGVSTAPQQELTVHFRGISVGSFRADLVVDGKVIVELKAVQSLEPIHEAQLINYLKATDCEVGLLLNFGQKPQFKRLTLSNNRKRNLAPTADAG